MVRRAPTIGAAMIAWALVMAAPARAQADDPPLDRERITQYARIHKALNDARDEFHGKVGRIHDEQGRERARVEMDEEISAALEAGGMTREEYDHITLIISMDGEARAVFDEVLAEIIENGGSG